MYQKRTISGIYNTTVECFVVNNFKGHNVEYFIPTII